MNRATVRDLQGGSSVTAADRAIGMLLREALPEDEAGCQRKARMVMRACSVIGCGAWIRLTGPAR